jgi:O-antigen ligase
MSKAISIGLVVAIVFTTLAHGAVEAWSVAGFGLIVITLLVMWAIKIVRDKQIVVTLPAAFWPLIALLVYAMIQSMAFTNSEGQRSSLSMDVEATRAALPVLFSLVVVFLMTLNFVNLPERLNRLVSFLIFYGLALVLFALIQYFTWNGKIYWLRPTSYSAFGPFVNRNHFAGYLEMLIPLPIALIVARAIRKDMWMIYGFAAVLMSLAVIISTSRGGMISVVASLVFIALAKSRLKRNVRRRDALTSNKPGASFLWLKRIGSVAAIVAVLVLGIVWLGAEPVLNRLAHSIDQAKASTLPGDSLSRSGIWRDTRKMIQANMIFGAGLGAYETALPIYSLNTMENVVTHSHNDYLQILADCGVIGGALAVWFITLIFRAIWQGLKSQDALLAALALGGGAGIFAMLVHSLFDFNLQIPSNALLFLTLCAMVSHIAVVARNTDKALQKATSVSLAKVV